jgi:hypothetical protein
VWPAGAIAGCLRQHGGAFAAEGVPKRPGIRSAWPAVGRIMAAGCKSLIAAHTECYLFCGSGRPHGVAPRGETRRASSLAATPAIDVGLAQGKKVRLKGEFSLHEHHHRHDERAEARA